MPARTIGLCYRSVGGRIPFGRRAHSVAVESTLERDFVFLQRFDPDVIDIAEQPVRIRYAGQDGREHSYVPDFLVRRSSGPPPQLVEVKYANDPSLREDATRVKHERAAAFASRQGWSFSLITDRDIRTPRLTNARFLLPFRDRPGEPALIGKIAATIEAGPGRRIGEVVAEVVSRETAAKLIWPALWHQVAMFQVWADLDEVLTPQSLIRPGNGRPSWVG